MSCFPQAAMSAASQYRFSGSGSAKKPGVAARTSLSSWAGDEGERQAIMIPLKGSLGLFSPRWLAPLPVCQHVHNGEANWTRPTRTRIQPEEIHGPIGITEKIEHKRA